MDLLDIYIRTFMYVLRSINADSYTYAHIYVCRCARNTW